MGVRLRHRLARVLLRAAGATGIALRSYYGSILRLADGVLFFVGIPGLLLGLSAMRFSGPPRDQTEQDMHLRELLCVPSPRLWRRAQRIGVAGQLLAGGAGRGTCGYAGLRQTIQRVENVARLQRVVIHVP